MNSIKDIDLKHKRIFLRVDFNVPIKDGIIVNDFKIRNTIPTIIYLIEQKVESIFIVSHLGRPTGIDSRFTLKPIYKYIKPLFTNCGLNLQFTNFYDSNVRNFVLFENIRFLDEEDNTKSTNIDKFSQYVQLKCDISVVDAFGTFHRECASLIHTRLPIYWGLLVTKELLIIDKFMLKDEKIDVLILGGKKMKDKVEFLFKCVKKTKNIFILGAICHGFLKYNGENIGDNIVENDMSDVIKNIYAEADKYGTKIMLPIDWMVLKNDKYYVQRVIHDGIALDIGPVTIKYVNSIILGSDKVFWNGPVGKFENESCQRGTKELIECFVELENRGKNVLIGGGETSFAVEKYAKDKLENVSTGGGSLLACLENRDEIPILKLKKKHLTIL